MNISMLNPEFFYEYLNKVCILQDRQSRMIFFYLTGLQINQKEKMIFQLVVISTMIYSGRITIKLMKNNERNILNIFESAFFQQQDIFLCYFV
ncbi:unnamed protein product [Paramecium sonneborni]|uniref:Uncharacterized protein n=1 Tax=Paramecium sonneborni TaxID=65129 RepID=A0A8S1PGA9_9CILI|nr:unnamed protein product [Paramecium sonneborni]